MNKIETGVVLVCVTIFGVYYSNKKLAPKIEQTKIIPKSTPKELSTIVDVPKNKESHINQTASPVKQITQISMPKNISRNQPPVTNEDSMPDKRQIMTIQEVPNDRPEPTAIDFENQEQEALLEEIIEKQRQEDEEMLLNPDKKARRRW